MASVFCACRTEVACTFLSMRYSEAPGPFADGVLHFTVWVCFSMVLAWTPIGVINFSKRFFKRFVFC